MFFLGHFPQCWKRGGIFGANCNESSSVTKKYVRSLLPQIAELERGEYEFEGIKFRFKLEELPNDMKMLAMLAG